MKTLDEVIKAMESCNCHDFVCHQCPYYDDDDEVGCRSDDKEEDALHYLKEYRMDKENFAEAIHNCGLAESKYITALYELKYGKERDEQRDNA